MAKLSEIKGMPIEDEPGLGTQTLSGLVQVIAERYGDLEALNWNGLDGVTKSWSYRDVYDESLAVARALLAAGVGKDSRVGVLISNRPEWLFCMFGAAMAGAVTVALNTFSTEQELRHQLEVAAVGVLIMEPEVASKDFVSEILSLCPELNSGVPGELYSATLPYLRRVVCIDPGFARAGLQDLSDFLVGGSCVPEQIVKLTAKAVNPIDSGVIFFSSGSTALPKAILHTQRAAVLQCQRCANLFEVDTSTRTWNANGYFFSGNFAMAFGTLCQGGTLVMSRYFDPDAALALIQEQKVTCILTWPHQDERLTACPGWAAADLSALKKLANEDSAIRSHPTFTSDWRGINGYGMTETFTFISAISGIDHSRGSAGKVWPGNTVRIIDPETGEILPLGETGEIIIKGPTLMLGYLGVPPDSVFDESGFIHTSDAGYLTEDGHLFWEGRLSDIIKTGGANVSPTEVDAILLAHPAVQSVCTVGIPHKSLGEIVVSCVVLHDDHDLEVETLKSYAKEHLATYKVPREVLFLKEEELPMTGSNKIRRADLKSLAVEKLGTQRA